MVLTEIIQILMRENETEVHEYSDGFLLKPADDEKIEQLAHAIEINFSVAVSSEYLDVLKVSDRFSVNGLNLYGSTPLDKEYFLDGIIEANQSFWIDDSLKRFFAYGEESSTRLVFNLKTGLYEAVDNVTWECLEVFDSFSKLLSYVIEEKIF